VDKHGKIVGIDREVDFLNFGLLD